jgi:hypothetical protein
VWKATSDIAQGSTYHSAFFETGFFQVFFKSAIVVTGTGALLLAGRSEIVTAREIAGLQAWRFGRDCRGASHITTIYRPSWRR